MTSGIDIQAAAANVVRRRERREAANRRRFERAQREFDALVAMLIRVYRPQCIYQWGSLLEPRRFSERSDIDIAVQGSWSPEQFFALLGDAMELTSLPLDLVDLERTEPLHARTIRERGRLVYERQD